MREIKRNGWVFRLAYGYYVEEKKIPYSTSLCKLFWRAMFGTFVAWPFIGIVLLVLSTLSITFFAHLPNLSEDRPGAFNQVNWWPKFRGHYVWPGTIMLLALIAYFSPQIILTVSGGVRWLSDQYTMVSLVVLAIVLIVSTLAFFRWFRRTEVGYLTRNYLRALKEKACPIVQIEVPRRGGQVVDIG